MLARRIDDIQPFHVMALLARARELEAAGRDIVHMEIGEPDFPTPQPVLEAVQQAIATGDVHYTPARGLTPLREAIAADYRDRLGVTVPAERILITPGASGALLLVLGLLVDRDQQVLMADPGYPCNRNFVRFVEGRAATIPVGSETEFQLTPELLEANWHDNTVAALVASPSNPTGTLIEPSVLSRMADQALQRGGFLIVDEIYQRLVYDRRPATILSHTSDVFVINSFSKYFNMTGWRIGWLVAPEQFIEPLDRLAQNLFLAAPTAAQHGAVAALSDETLQILEQRREEFARRRDFLLPALRDLGFGIPQTPEGAFYLYADCSRFTDDSFAFTTQLLEEAGVAITPGCDFGDHAAAEHVRFAYTTGLERLQEGVERLRRFLNK
jgi:aspartate/methionine/tyrosine aminotransferase